MWYFMSYSNNVDKIKAGEYADFAEMPPAKGKSKLLSIISPERASGASSGVRLVSYHESFAWFGYLGSVFCNVCDSRQYPPTTRSTWPHGLYVTGHKGKPEVPLSIMDSVWPIFWQQAAKAENTENTEWARVDPSIYTQCFTGMALSAEGWCKFCQSIDHPSDNCLSWPSGVPTVSLQLMPQIETGICQRSLPEI